jgi:hypothetical protein
MNHVDWQRIAPEIAKQILGEPTSTSSKELRFGSKGSICINLESGTFFDFESDTGGGMIDFIKHFNKDVNSILEQFGYDLTLQQSNSQVIDITPIVKTNVRSFSNARMLQLRDQSIISVKYSDAFEVMRFAKNHPIKQKYAPFTKSGTEWIMARPEGLLPLYVTNNHPSKPVLVGEGEKAMRGAEHIYNGDVCCWHGGATGWNKTDWSPIYKRAVWIWADNDAVGKKAATEISEHLRANGCTNVKVITPPEDFKEKDDLYDAYESGYFKDSQALESFIYKQKEKLPIGSLRFQRADYVLSQIESPDWLIENCFEKSKLITVFGAPKSGKSFVAIAMACAIARGGEFYGHKATQAPVVYLAGEGVSGIRARLGAMHQYVKREDESGKDKGLEGVPLFLSNRGSRINEADELVKLETEITLLQKEVGSIGLIILDTFQRCYSGDENSASEVNKFIKACDQLIQTFDCTVLMVHHTGRGNTNRARGSSVLDASIDGEFIVERKGTKADDDNSMLVTMKQTKNKDGMGMTEKKFEFHEEVLIGDGFEVTSGLLIETQEKIFSTKEMDNLVDKKILNLLYFLAKDKKIPEEEWFTAKDFGHHAVYSSSGKDFGRNTINNSLKRLVKANLVEQKKTVTGVKSHQGYRLKEFKAHEIL